jgi:hypothetical protein
MQKSSEYAKELDKNDELSHYRQKFISLVIKMEKKNLFVWQ